MIRIFLTCVVAAVLSGCAGYHIGPVAPKFMDGVHTIAVPTSKNKTLEPHIEVLVTNQVIKQLQQDGTLQVVDSDRADAILDCTIDKIRRRPARSVRGNVLATREFIISLHLVYQVKNRATGKLLREGSVVGDTNFFVGADIQQQDRQAIPLAAEEAATHLVSQITEGW